MVRKDFGGDAPSGLCVEPFGVGARFKYEFDEGKRL
jgi:hypothetical protein